MRFLPVPMFFLSAVVLLASCSRAGRPERGLTSVAVPPAAAPNAHYVSNRLPLRVSPLVKLPVGTVTPKGWLLGQLRLMREGFSGRLGEISRFLGPDSGWITLKGRGWEEMPYWLKGFGDLAYLLRDPDLEREAERWLDHAFSSQQEDGYFGPADNRASGDLWPNMVMLAAMRSRYEATGDGRVLPFMTRYFRYESGIPEADLLPGSWQKLRGGENLESVTWLYNRTGETFLLDLARRLFARTADWTSPILSPERDADWVESSFYHGVNIAMGFRYPALFWPYTGDPGFLEAVERNYRQVMDSYGRQPGGMFGADENIRPGKAGPRQGAETCSMVEFMASFESLLAVTGAPVWADRCEEVAFNSLPASMTPDLKALHYLTAPNLVSCDSSGEHDFQNTGTLVSYDPWNYRCCQHNVAFGWPYFAEHLWMATADNGLAAVLYAPSTVKAKVADGVEVEIAEETRYPFEEGVEMKLTTGETTTFPLYLRIPGWSAGGRVLVNGEEVGRDLAGGRFAVLVRPWRTGDRVRLELDAEVRIEAWAPGGEGVSVRRGPLWYSLEVGEEWRRYGGTDEWPAWEVLPTTPWNYGLAVDPAAPGETIRVRSRRAPADQPFTPDAAPLVLSAPARRIPGWTAEGRMVGPLPASPAEGDGPVVEVRLIPMGCARLRISVFPTVSK